MLTASLCADGVRITLCWWSDVTLGDEFLFFTLPFSFISYLDWVGRLMVGGGARCAL